MYKNEFSDLLIAIGKYVKSLSDEDYYNFLKGNFQLIEFKQKNNRKKESFKLLSDNDIDIIINKIRMVNNRDEAKYILDNDKSLSFKENLVKVARSLKIL